MSEIYKFSVDALTSQERADRFKELLQQVGGIEQIDINLEKRLVRIISSLPLPIQEIKKQLSSQGFHFADISQPVSQSQPASPVINITPEQPTELTVCVAGMTCQSCELTIERKFKKIPGVKAVDVNAGKGIARIVCENGFKPDIRTLQQTVGNDKYTIKSFHGTKHQVQQKKHDESEKKPSFGRLILVFATVLIAIKIFSGLGLSDLAGSIGGNTSFFAAVVIGLLAGSSSCIAVAGGLLLSSAKKFHDRYGNGTFAQRMKPVFLFVGGRVLSYAFLGGLIGAIGQALNPSPAVTGVIVLFAAVYMVVMGLNMLHISPPWLKKLQPRMPKAFGRRVLDAEDKEHPLMPAALGAATFFLPCGFTQALQIYALSTGSFTTGALILGGFALGTAPVLTGLGWASTSLKGKAGKLFFQFSGALVIVLGIWNINNGFTLTGHPLSWPSFSFGGSVQAATQDDPNVKIVDGKQVVNMKIDGLTYSPSRFTVVEGIPVEWNIDGTGAEGCAQVISVPSLGMTELVNEPKTIEFTPTKTGKISFSCTMGMTTSGARFDVVSNDGSLGSVGALPPANTTQPTAVEEPSPCETGDCQTVNLTVSRSKGFYPRQFTVKKGTPVEVNIDAQVQLGGCMGTLLMPQYDLAHPVTLGSSSFTFTPTEAGDVPLTCAMGLKLVNFTVTD